MASEQYWVRFGNPHNMGKAKPYPAPSKAKNAAIKVLEDWKPHALRYDNDAHAKLCQATQDIDELASDVWGTSPWTNSSAAEPMSWEVHLGYGTRVRVEMWRA